MKNKKAVTDRLRYLLDYSFYRFDLHHVELTVNYFTFRSRRMDYLTIADIDRNVTAVAAVVIANNVACLDLTSRYADAGLLPDLRSAVRP